MALHRWEDVRAELFAGREAAILAAKDQLRAACAEQDLIDERDLQAYDQEMSGG
jgi:hypothetical protein